MNNAITQFEYGPTGTQMRTVEIDGEPWFVAKDVCEVLGIVHAGSSLKKVPDSQKGVHQIHTPGGTQQLSIVSESGLYRLIMRSDRPEAEPFIAWVTEEVLPMIRKTNGAYLSKQKTEELLADPDLIISLAQQVKQIRQEQEEKEAENKRLSMRIVEDLPKVAYADTVMASDKTTSLTQTAKTFGLGPNKFIEFLRLTNRLYKRGEENLPRQLYVDNGVFKTSIYTCPGGKITTQTRVTGKGQRLLYDHVLKHQMAGTYPHLIGYAGGDF